MSDGRELSPQVQEWEAEWADRGSEAVRHQIKVGLFSDKKKSYALAWLERLDREAADDQRARELGLLQRSTEAAESSAGSARTSKWYSGVAALAALAAVVVSIIALVQSGK